jgi:hypothetical protein
MARDVTSRLGAVFVPATYASVKMLPYGQIFSKIIKSAGEHGADGVADNDHASATFSEM